MGPRPPRLSPRSRRKQVLVIQWSVQPWRGPLLQSHGRLAQGLMRPCELYFLTSYSCPEAHESFTQDMENVWKCMAVTDKDVALFSFFISHIWEKNHPKLGTGDIWVTGGLSTGCCTSFKTCWWNLTKIRNYNLELRCLYTYKALRYWATYVLLFKKNNLNIQWQEIFLNLKHHQYVLLYQFNCQ